MVMYNFGEKIKKKKKKKKNFVPAKVALNYFSARFLCGCEEYGPHDSLTHKKSKFPRNRSLYAFLKKLHF